MPTVDICSPGGAFTPAAVGDGVTDDAPRFAPSILGRNLLYRQYPDARLGSKTFLFDSADSDNTRGQCDLL